MKLTDIECKDILERYGYSNYSAITNMYTKGIGEISDDDYFSIYAQIKDGKVQLSSNVMKFLITIQTPFIDINHPNFDGFENSLIDYIDACLEDNLTKLALYKRTEKRKNR